jgi:hypothetical protein
MLIVLDVFQESRVLFLGKPFSVSAKLMVVMTVPFHYLVAFSSLFRILYSTFNYYLLSL